MSAFTLKPYCQSDSGEQRQVINKFPWQVEPLDKWSICGMNHYHQDGKRMLFVSMTKDGKCITAEGEDNWAIWNNLFRLATISLRIEESNEKGGPA